MKKQKKQKLKKLGTKAFHKIIAKVVAIIAKEYECYCPPYRKMLYIYLLARAEMLNPPREIADQLKTTNKKNLEYCVNKFDTLLHDLPANLREVILIKLITALQPEEEKYKKEEARQNAFDEILDALSEWSTDQLACLVEKIKSKKINPVELSV